MTPKMKAIIQVVRSAFESGDIDKIDAITYFVQGITKTSNKDLENYFPLKIDNQCGTIDDSVIIEFNPPYRGNLTIETKVSYELNELFNIIAKDFPELILVIKYLIAYPDYRKIILQDLDVVRKISLVSNS